MALNERAQLVLVLIAKFDRIAVGRLDEAPAVQFIGHLGCAQQAVGVSSNVQAGSPRNEAVGNARDPIRHVTLPGCTWTTTSAPMSVISRSATSSSVDA